MSTRKAYRTHFEKVASPVLKQMVQERKVSPAAAKHTLVCIRAALPVRGHTDEMMRRDARSFARAWHRWQRGAFQGGMDLPWPMVG